ncbi:hypothetical protein V496_02060 [Pseudogymnoascus sp. VKM F-4515 (FW-2607)]|nr:hypothetical protein V496_02060 [Pseudogymnoascus sp. VKM F-4515 (FW-2607)]
MSAKQLSSSQCVRTDGQMLIATMQELGGDRLTGCLLPLRDVLATDGPNALEAQHNWVDTQIITQPHPHLAPRNITVRARRAAAVAAAIVCGIIPSIHHPYVIPPPLIDQSMPGTKLKEREGTKKKRTIKKGKL